MRKIPKTYSLSMEAIDNLNSQALAQNRSASQTLDLILLGMNKAVKNKESIKAFAKPSHDDVMYHMECKCGIGRDLSSQEAVKFIAHYESNGWKVGKNKMKSWEAAAIGWIKRNQQNGNKVVRRNNSDLLEQVCRQRASEE